MLPIYLSQTKEFVQMQNVWAAQLNPVLANPTTNMQILKGVALINGATVINHLLGRMQQGWTILDQNAQARIYRSQPLNSTTLTLTSDAAVTVNLGVY